MHSRAVNSDAKPTSKTCEETKEEKKEERQEEIGMSGLQICFQTDFSLTVYLFMPKK
jgi:hypothetical protein